MVGNHRSADSVIPPQRFENLTVREAIHKVEGCLSVKVC